jgi:hypothetical protein
MLFVGRIKFPLAYVIKNLVGSLAGFYFIGDILAGFLLSLIIRDIFGKNSYVAVTAGTTVNTINLVQCLLLDCLSSF